MKREDVIKFNRKLNNVDILNPLSIGNGDFLMTLDITSTQTFSNDYKDIPLTTISNKLWFKKKIKRELKLSEIDGKKYMLSPNDDNDLYQLKRCYPHKYNLYLIQILYKGELLDINKIKNPTQELDLYYGISKSKFKYEDEDVEVESLIYQDSDTFKFKIDANPNFSIRVIFTYPSYEKNGYISNKIPIVKFKDDSVRVIYDKLNSSKLYINSNLIYKLNDNYLIYENFNSLDLTISLNQLKNKELLNSFWDEDNSIILDDYKLSERMILSKYLLKLNSTGIYPPSEAGLTFNNWNSKFHLEMHLIHSLWLIYDNHLDLLLKSFDYYKNISRLAKKRARLNGYKGIRMPKMTSPDGLDSPSPIGPLLLWQAPHIPFIMQEIYKVYKDKKVLRKYKTLIKDTIDFMISFLTFENGEYHIKDPVLACCESIPYQKCINPIFEMEYFRHVFKNQELIDKLLFNKSRYDYKKYYDLLAKPKDSNGIYLKTHSMNDEYDIYPDHPIETFSYSYFKSDFINPDFMNKTLDFVINNLDLSSYWGWDFPLMGMCALNLGYIDKGINIAMMEADNNGYLYNGHNTSSRDDLKIYLPGNGAYLLFYRLLSNMR